MSGIFGTRTKASSPTPAVGALQIQQSSFGVPISLLYGTNRATGNLIWYGDFRSVKVKSGSGGGKGGGGGGSSYTWNYYASFMIGLGQGEIQSIGRVWENKKQTSVSDLGGSVSRGTLAQAAWGYLSTYHPDEAIPYNRLAHVDFADYFLGESSSTPNLAFEIFATPDATTPSGQDCWPASFVTDFLARAGFPSAYLDTLSGSSFDTYTKAMGFGISPFLTEQESAADHLKRVMDTLNCEFVWSSGLLKIIPYGDSTVTGNGVTFAPDLTPQYDITDDDIIADDEEEYLTAERADLADCYNQQPIEFKNKNNSYNTETYTAEDAGHIDMFGIRTASTLNAHHVTDPMTAQTMGSLYLWRNLYCRTRFTLKLGWKFCLLDPMDYVTITSDRLGYDRALVQVVDVESDEDGILTFTMQEVPGNLAAPAMNASPATTRYNPDYSAAPGSVNDPVIFEPPMKLLQSTSVEAWMIVSSASENWGGCNVFVSTDNATFQLLGKITEPGRTGLLTATLPSTNDAVDSTNVLSVNLSESGGTINAAPTHDDALNLNTLSYVDGELLAFGASSLTAANQYDLSYLVRGAYGSAVDTHYANARFAYLDSSVFKYAYDQTRIGKTLYFKFQSFNIYGAGLEDISALPSYAYTLTGSALTEGLPNIINLTVNYIDGIGTLNWSAISDIRSPIWYEIREGADFQQAQIVSTTKEVKMSVYGTDTYWVSALYYTPTGQAIYSNTPASIVVSTPAITDNVIATYEEATAWTGTCAGGAAVSGGTVTLTDGSNILDATNVFDIPNVLAYGSVSLSGSYTIPSGHIISLAAPVKARVMMSWELSAISTSSDITAEGDITGMSDVTGIVDSGLVYAVPQIRLSTDGGASWGDWQNWSPGSYFFNAIDRRILIYSLSETARPILSAFSTTVDVQKLPQNGSVTTSTGGLVSVTFPTAYNAMPGVTPQIVDAQANDRLVCSSISTTGFQCGVINGGSYVARTVSWTSVSY